jgi:hypothetical protein
MMKMFSCVTLALTGLVACAAGSTAPEDSILLGTTDAGAAAPVVLATDSGGAAFQSDAASGAAPGNVSLGGGAADTGAGVTPVSGFDAGAGGGFDAGSSSEDTGSGFDAGTGGGFDAGSGEDAGGAGVMCEGYADPNTTAGCTCAATDPSECQANGCYGGYWCDTSSNGCRKDPPSGC